MRTSICDALNPCARLQRVHTGFAILSLYQIGFLNIFKKNPMSHKYQARNPEGLYFVTFTIVDWVDIFIRQVYKEEIIKSLQYCQKHKGL